MRTALFVVCACVLAAPGAAAAPPIEEAAAVGYLRRGRYHELKAFVESLPESSPYKSLLGPPARRLVEIKDRLVAAVNAGGMEVEFEAVHPAAFEGGRIVAATPHLLKIRNGERERDVYWNGLPLSVTVEMARRFLAADAAQDPTLLRDLGEAAGIVGEAGSPEQTRVETTLGVLRALHDMAAQTQPWWADRRFDWSVAWARARVANLPRVERESPWLALARRWLERLEKAEADREARKAEAARRLPKGAVVHLCEDFEEGPELVPPGWWRGDTCPPPDGATPANRWCRQTILGEKNVMSGEIFETLDALRFPDRPRDPLFIFREGLCFSARVWGANVDRFVLILNADGHEGHSNFSNIEVALPRMDEWRHIRIRLDDLSLHRPYAWGDVPLFAIGAPVLGISFVARRADTSRDDGVLYLDNLLLYTAPEDDGGKAADDK